MFPMDPSLALAAKPSSLRNAKNKLEDWKEKKRAYIWKEDGEVLTLNELKQKLDEAYEKNPEEFAKQNFDEPWFGNKYFVPFKDDEATDNGLKLTVQIDPYYQRDWASQQHGTAGIPKKPPLSQDQNTNVDTQSSGSENNEQREPTNPKQKFVVTAPDDPATLALPSWLRFNLSKEEFQDVFKNSFSDRERLEFKRALFSAGYFEGAWEKRQVPESGKFLEEDVAAIDSLFADTEKKTYGNSIASTLVNKIKAEEPNLRSVTSAVLGIEENLAGLQQTSEKLLNRRLTEAEQKQVVDAILGFNQETTPYPQEGARVQQGGQLLTGGDANSAALRYGRDLARSWGLQPIRGYVDRAAQPNLDPAVYEGRSMRIAGNSEYMLAFVTWANSETGKNKTFEVVRPVYDTDPNTPDYIEIVFNKNAVSPTIASDSFGYRRDDDRQRFIDAVRRPGEFLAYNWDGNGPAQRGAYLINENTYKAYSDLLGLDENDKSVANQDKVAGAYAQDLWDRFKDWDLAAVAIRFGESVAENLKARGGIEGSSDENLKKWVRGVRTSMANWQPRFAPALMGEDQYGTQGGPAARAGSYGNVLMGSDQFGAAAESEFRRRFAKEISQESILDGVVWMLKQQMAERN